ncbi:anthranilate phosphoribosyltransferase [Deinococcus aquiradiocola]|uniref:Anthranilate phosphoribosyltransferase n=1 Tax=Deinococcus aquiradiocola TaxID=393059 RepID=A0A917P6R4_9DEIO|nr:anthranilate phosphoribosyltransferase [Deinococcus aquiradiocola]GGJ64117.1 anthranilate phosphoribosyltransferase [Deinococcus aquiradiocola]
MHTRLMNGETLTQTEAHAYMGQVMTGEISAVRLGAALAALRVRGETPAEIAGFAQAMRENAVHLPIAPRPLLLDVVGTGGDGAHTFNISTTSAFVVAAGGVPVAKHGNRAASSKAGSADVLEALGVNLEADPARVAQAIDELGVGFMFARNYHPALRHAAPVRGELAARTVFNVLGPLSNPAGATHLVVGVYTPALTRTLADVLRLLGTRAALVVSGGPAGRSLDEFSVSGENTVSELRDGTVTDFTLTPEEAGVSRHAPEALVGGTPAENAVITRAVLQGGGTPAQRDIVALNSGAALYLAGRADSVAAGVTLAGRILASGEAWTLLERYAAHTRA